MSTCYGDPVLDFDLNFLRPSSSSTVTNSKTDKQRKAILIVKKKTIATDSLIKKYYAKREALDQTERNLLSSKEECKQICIDYRKSVDTCANLEKDLLQLRESNKELEKKYSNLENQFQAVNSHANQLQVLVKEHETLIEGLKIENKLSKNHDKDYKKMLQPLQKENSLLIKHICLARDIIFGKIKCRLPHKTLLKKYDKYKSPDKDDPLFREDECNDDYASDDIPLSPYFEEYIDEAESLKGNKSQTIIDAIHNSNIADQNRISANIIAECNDVASIDTGRGSSMAFSVSDKSFHSPDYYINDSPLSDDPELNKVKTKLVDSATSPLPFYDAVDVSTSPISFDNNLVQHNNVIDRALSPIVLPVEIDNDILVTNRNVDVFRSMNRNSEQECCKDNRKSIEGEEKRKERECLELNNSENISNEKSHDCEIEMILSTMRLHNTLITPIPATPATSYSISRDNIHCTPNKQQEHSPKVVCPEAVLAREENKKLQATVSELAKELLNIKNMLISRPTEMYSNEESVLDNESCPEDSINANHVKSIIQSIPKDVTSTKTKDTTICMTENQHLQSNRKSLDINVLELSNNEKLHTIPEVEENYTDTSTLQSKDLIASKNEKETEVPVVNETNLRSSEAESSIDSQSPMKDDQCKLKFERRQKITKLGRFKQKLLPKYKIRRECLPVKKGKVKLKQVINPNKKKITATDSSITLNNKNVYEKAVKVMTELKCKKSISTENKFVRLNEKKNIGDAKKQEESCSLFSQTSNPIHTPSNGINNDLSLGTLESEVLKTIGIDENRDKVIKELSKSPVSKRHLKRISEDFTSEIPCKRVLRSSTLDNFIAKDPKVLLHRCEEPIGTEYISAVDNAKNVLNTINISPKNRKSPSKSGVGSIYSPGVSSKTSGHQEKKCNSLSSHQRECSKSMSFPEVSPKESDIQGKNDIQSITSNRRKSARVLSFSEVNPKVSEHNSNQDLTSYSRSVKDTFSPQVSPKVVERQDKNENTCIQNLGTNRRKSVKEMISPVSPKEPENQNTYKNQDIEDLAGNQRNSVKEMFSVQVSPKAVENQERNIILGIQDLVSNRSESVKEMSSLEVTPSDFQQRNNRQGVCNKKRKIDRCFPGVSANAPEHNQESSGSQNVAKNPRESVLCQMIEQFGVKSVKFRVKKVSDSITNSTAKKIEDDIARIKELPANEAKEAMNKFVLDIQHWDIKHFLAGLIKYLKDPTRKTEMFNKVVATSAPSLTKPEQILLYVISELKTCWYPADIVDKILNCMEYTLFSLNRTPQIDVIESMSHFYAAVCRFFNMKTRLRLFILDAMYCIQFKAVPLVKQCVEVWTHILPLAHMASAQTPLVICLVYLLHFYKCDDKFNRVQEIRNILTRKYFYKIIEWNETKILELFRNSIKELRGSPADMKMLRIALIILAKRHGPRWCQNNIVKNLLQPMIEKQNNSEHVKAFCISMLGPLLKPFPADMKVHCEIVMNQLITMLQEDPSPKIAEAAVTSLIYINRHNQFRVIQALVAWRPLNISTELEIMLKEFVKSKPLKIWKSTLSKAVQ